jgi:hypothetical protein
MSAATKPTATPSGHPYLDALIDDWRQGKRPISLKIADRIQVEIKDEASFRILLDLLDRLENVAAIQKGLDDFAEGRMMTLDEFKQKVRSNHGIPD